ncbi:hypothetical protein MBLNU459_g0955t1 [Dothideomycetes sp. NU459]
MAKYSHSDYMRLALLEAQKSPPKPTNYCVGALLVSPSSAVPVLATGYTLELPGNTHAEQCAFAKFAESSGVSEDQIGAILPEDTILYTTMEPNKGIRKVFIGVKEPEKFVGENGGRRKLEDNGIEVVHISGMEDEILKVATAGHEK